MNTVVPPGHVIGKQPITIPLNALVIDDREKYLKGDHLGGAVIPNSATTSDESVYYRQTKLVNRMGLR